jgi:endonuclease/exonuclease/phosphatase (EEP) superfamily protein YafD
MRLFGRWFVLACAAAALASAFVPRFVPDVWAEIARFVPYPVFVAPALLAVMLSWLLGRRWQCLALATFAVIATQSMGLAAGRSQSGSGRFTVMTYNVKSYLAVRKADGIARLAWEIARHDPDVLVMQDAQALTGVRAAPILGAVAGRQIHRDGQYIVASRFRIEDCSAIDMSPPGQEETFLHCTLEIRDRPVALFAVHFVSPRDGTFGNGPQRLLDVRGWETNLADRLAQARAVARAVSAVQGRVIVAGDLNAAEDSPVVRELLDVGLRDAFSSGAVGYGYTYGHALLGASFLRIDHILFGGGIGARSCAVGDPAPSEHRPVIAELFVDSDRRGDGG